MTGPLAAETRPRKRRKPARRAGSARRGSARGRRRSGRPVPGEPVRVGAASPVRPAAMDKRPATGAPLRAISAARTATVPRTRRAVAWVPVSRAAGAAPTRTARPAISASMARARRPRHVRVKPLTRHAMAMAAACMASAIRGQSASHSAQRAAQRRTVAVEHVAVPGQISATMGPRAHDALRQGNALPRFSVWGIAVRNRGHEAELLGSSFHGRDPSLHGIGAGRGGLRLETTPGQRWLLTRVGRLRRRGSPGRPYRTVLPRALAGVGCCRTGANAGAVAIRASLFFYALLHRLCGNGSPGNDAPSEIAERRLMPAARDLMGWVAERPDGGGAVSGIRPPASCGPRSRCGAWC